MSTASTKQTGQCERIVVTTADGRVFDLGSPESRLFPIRLALYKFHRRKEH